MSLRCRPGDLAMVVGEPRNLGALVTVIGPDEVTGWWFVEALSNMKGFIDGGSDVVMVKPGMKACCCDKNLQPLRNSPGWDETLDWQPVPGVKFRRTA